jgi:hypothetical protein
MRISALLKAAALSVAVLALGALPAGAIDGTGADVREGPEKETVQGYLLTATREAPAAYRPVPTSFAAARESSSVAARQYFLFASTREAPAVPVHYDSLASVRETAPRAQPGWANTLTAARERYAPAPALAAGSPVEVSDSPVSDVVIFGFGLATAVLLGAGLWLAVAHRRVRSIA